MSAATGQSDDGFHDFVVGFADPLARLAFLLTVGTAGAPTAALPTDSLAADSLTAHALATDALAQVRRRWREAEATGAPEPLAVEALIAALPHHRRPTQLADTPADQGGAELDVDIDVLRDGLWNAWKRLAPRQRVPVVFVDPSVASRRLSGLTAPESFSSARRLDLTASAALHDVRTSLLADPTTRRGVEALSDQQFGELLADTLREQGSTTSAPIDPYPVVMARVVRMRRRTAAAVALVVVVLGVGATIAVNASRVPKAPKVIAAALGTAGQSGKAPTAGAAPLPAANSGLVVDWPTRGTAAGDPGLIAKLKAAFVQAHGDATGQVQVLLVTDTPAFRVAYLTANSPSGVLQSWFYGAVGSTNLVEGVVDYGGNLVGNATVLATGLVDAQGQTELVVIAPPGTTQMRLADFDFSKPVGPGFEPLPFQDGFAVKDVPTGSVPTLVLDVQVGANVFESSHLPTLPLGPRFAGTSAPDAPPAATPSIAVDLGTPDQQVLADALYIAGVWHQNDAPATPLHAKVLWGGTDPVGTEVVAVRLKIALSDLLLVEWNNDAPGQHGEYLLHSGLADAPLAFAYRGLDVTRIGVLGPAGATSAALVMAGEQSASVRFDAAGFASLPLPGVNRLSDIAVTVNLFDAAGHVITTVPMPPPE